MPRQDHQKLVRDKIPEIIKAAGETAHTRILDQDDFRAALIEKLEEAAFEVTEACREGEPAKILEELGDLSEVVRTIAAQYGITSAQIKEVCLAKREKRGGFDKRIFLEYTE
jgi:predicted house-cleaning noncanonical NTP pyrophosphatase (MazG superfamily)